MKLYNVTFYLEDKRSVLEPTIPETAGDTENKTIERICLTDSIVYCIQALAHCNRNVRRGERFLVREVEIDRNDKYLITPEELKQKGYVPDALENNEYWYTKPLEFDLYLCEVGTFDYEYELAWTCIDRAQCVDILSKYAPTELFNQCESSEEVYQIFSRWCNERDMWNQNDEAWEELSMLPWAQKTKLYNFQYSTLQKINSKNQELEEPER